MLDLSNQTGLEWSTFVIFIGKEPSYEIYHYFCSEMQDERVCKIMWDNLDDHMPFYRETTILDFAPINLNCANFSSICGLDVREGVNMEIINHSTLNIYHTKNFSQSLKLNPDQKYIF